MAFFNTGPDKNPIIGKETLSRIFHGLLPISMGERFPSERPFLSPSEGSIRPFLVASLLLTKVRRNHTLE